MKISGSFLLLASGAAAFTQGPSPFAFKTAESSSSTAVFSSYLSDINSSNGRFSSNGGARQMGNRDMNTQRRNVQIDRNNDMVPPLARREDDQVRRLEQRLNQLERTNREQARRLRSPDSSMGYRDNSRSNNMDYRETSSNNRIMSNNRMDYRGSSDYPSEPGPAAIITDLAPRVAVQGGSLKTWSYASPNVERIHVVLKTDGRPLEADVSLWQGPDNTPHKMRVYLENGAERPFSAVFETPRGPNTVSIRNKGQLEFPLQAHVLAEDFATPTSLPAARKNDLIGESMTVQGGALRTYPFDPSVESVAVLLATDGRPLNARIELLQGPNNNKQVVEVYTEDGLDRPFFMVIETPGSGNVVRVVNTATVEFPLTAWVEPHIIGFSPSGLEPVIGGSDGGILDREFVNRDW
ncbi:hypothetical protein MPSEU_000186600 [Mayamaea pseudoterrestris]|nr:hypothetical protein MPSEU_000186600 [Mayamaea pseudoterrestris]